MPHVVCPHCLEVNRVPSDRPGRQARCGACHALLFAGKPASATEAAFAKHVARNDVPVLVDMWAPWCGPCRAMAPKFEAAAGLLEPDVRLLKINVDEAQTTAAQYNVQTIPTLLLFDQGREIARTNGVGGAESLAAWTRSQLATRH